MMTYIFFILFLIIFDVQCSQIDNSGQIISNYLAAPKTLNYTLVYNNRQIDCLNFTIVQRSVGNKNLPVWIAYKDDTQPQSIYFKKIEIYKDVGDFTFYHDKEKNSSLVYFHKLKVLKGTIGDRYEVDGLPLGESVINVSGKYVKENFDYVRNWNINPKLRPEPISAPDELKYKPTDSKTVYPEVMIVINHDLLQNILNPSNRYVKVIEYILTYMNAVDMIYTKLEKLNIEVNIAGIIIEEDSNVFPMVHDFNNRCKIESSKPAVNSNALLYRLGKLFHNLQDKFPRDSYDYVLYMLNSTMCDMTTKKRVIGDTIVPTLYYRIFPFEDLHSMVFPVSVLDHGKGLTGFAAANHEISHFMHVEHDSYEASDYGIMRDDDKFCRDCLNWSKNSTRSLTRYLRIIDHCYLINRPRSLLAPGPRPMVTADELCKCHNLTASYKNDVVCSDHVKCTKIYEIQLEKEYSKGPKPLDGTPCGTDEVCWNGHCVPVAA